MCTVESAGAMMSNVKLYNCTVYHAVVATIHSGAGYSDQAASSEHISSKTLTLWSLPTDKEIQLREVWHSCDLNHLSYE